MITISLAMHTYASRAHLRMGADYAYIVNTERTTNRTRANNKRITFICTLPVLTLEYKKLPSVCTLRHRVTDT